MQTKPFTVTVSFSGAHVTTLIDGNPVAQQTDGKVKQKGRKANKAQLSAAIDALQKATTLG